MEFREYKLGDLIELYDEINVNGEFSDVDDLQGINTDKLFQKCKSNKNDIDLFRYRICRKGMFSYNKATSRNGEKISIAYRTGEDCLVSPSYYCFSVKDVETLSPEYLDIWFKRPVFDRYARFNSWGSATEFFTFDDFCETIIRLPSLDEQHKILHIYNIVSKRINLLQEINRKLLNIARTIFKSWFVDYDPWEGCRPENWQEGHLGECLSVIESGSRPKGGAESEGIPSIGAENIESFGVYDYRKEKYISFDFFSKMKRGRVQSGDVLLYKDGAYTGKSSLALDGFPHAMCAINEHVFILRTNERLPSQFFLYMFLSVEENRKTLFSMASSKTAQPGLNQIEVSSLPIEIPATEDVQNFDHRITPIMKQIARSAKENQRLMLLRDVLLPKLVSGELDVSTLEI